MSHKMGESTRKGGVIWLIAAIVVAVMWVTSISVWTTLLLSWATVFLAWLLVKRNQRSIDSKDSQGAILAFGVLWGVTWGCGWAINKSELSILSVDTSWHGITSPFPYSFLMLLAMTAFVSVIAIAWLLTAVVPRSARGAGFYPIKVLARSWRRLKQENRLWPVASLAATLQVVATFIGYSAGPLLQIIAGLAAAYTQLSMMNVVERSDNHKACRTAVASPVKRRRIRRWQLIALFIAQTSLFLFYFLIQGAGEHLSMRPWLMYPLAWLSGLLIALFAWLVGRVKLVYYVVLLLILLANALLLGMIIGVYRMDMIIF